MGHTRRATLGNPQRACRLCFKIAWNFQVANSIDLQHAAIIATTTLIQLHSTIAGIVQRVEDRTPLTFHHCPSELWVGSLRPPECRSIMPVNCFAACQRYLVWRAFNDIRLRQFHSQFIIIFAASNGKPEGKSRRANDRVKMVYLDCSILVRSIPGAPPRRSNHSK